ncbi:hypothetical protein [Dactylosporangium sp. NPDC000521]|uniref:hypothetical protein n=1 Tax=Dactylosporangium sp. NPDC000521 TaxID=3363975 RepID=UPI0036759869
MGDSAESFTQAVLLVISAAGRSYASVVSVKAPAVGAAVDVAAAGDVSAPVFVDSTGRRGRRIRFFFHLGGVAALAYAVLVLVAALLITGPLDLLSFPAPGPSPSATTPAKKNPPAPGQPGSIGKRTTGAGSTRSSLTPSAASAPAGPSGSVTTTPTPEAASAAPSASPSTAPTRPSASTTPTASTTPEPSASQNAAPGVTVVVVVGPA